MKLINRYRCDPAGRQNAEAILNRNSDPDYLMNSKNEHIQPCDIKERYENNKGNWEIAKMAKRTKSEKESLRQKIKNHLQSNSISVKSKTDMHLDIPSQS